MIPSEEIETKNVKSDIPEWIRQTADWWSEGLIQDEDFIKGIQFLIGNKIIQV